MYWEKSSSSWSGIPFIGAVKSCSNPAKEMHAQWFVLDGSGTGELAGLRGDGGFEAQLGQHGSVWLDYSLARGGP